MFNYIISFLENLEMLRNIWLKLIVIGCFIIIFIIKVVVLVKVGNFLFLGVYIINYLVC